MQIQLIGSSDGELPCVRTCGLRTLSIDDRSYIVLVDLARVLEVDRHRIVRKLRGRARLVTAIDVDGAERNLIVAPVDAFFSRRKAEPGLDFQAGTV